jgi:hypothetical protein
MKSSKGPNTTELQLPKYRRTDILADRPQQAARSPRLLH